MNTKMMEQFETMDAETLSHVTGAVFTMELMAMLTAIPKVTGLIR